jgi:hypothetical protein
MRAVFMLVAIFFLVAMPARADPALEARVLRLEAQVKALQEGLKNALSAERVYNIKANGQPDACLSSGSADASAAKIEVFVGKCGAADQRNWKLQPAQP